MKKEEFAKICELIQRNLQEITKEFDDIWRKRVRLIGTQILMAFIFKTVLSKNKQGYGSTAIELWNNFSIKKIRTQQARAISASAMCQARKNLSPEAFTLLNDRIIEDWEKVKEENLWHGYRLFAVDGSKVNLPRELIREGYKTPGEHSYYPQGLVSCLYELEHKIPYDFEIVNHCNERISAIKHLEVLKEGDLAIFDRGYFSYVMLKGYQEKGVLTVFRLQKNICYKEIQEFCDGKEPEKIVILEAPKKTKEKVARGEIEINLEPVKVRLVKYNVSGKSYVVATTVLTEAISKEEIAGLYHERWGIEELYKVTKEIIEVEDFHGKTEQGVKQELYAHFVLITITRMLGETAEKKTRGKINFKNCINVIRQALEELIFLKTKRFIKKCMRWILESMGRIYQKARPGRSYPRISKKPLKRWKSSLKKRQ